MKAATTGFRAAALADWQWRVLDMALHVLAAAALPGPWVLQWLPDVALPALWVQSVWNDEFAPENRWALRIHRALHLRRHAWFGLALMAPVFAAQPAAALHVLVHVGIDSLTHRKEWQ